ncbi:MAG: hypothetical protein JO292_11830, partial [Betaproteobacteria bacterium]|nr:hypothetical protein [Betaproteobacteria bacterium]
MPIFRCSQLRGERSGFFEVPQAELRAREERQRGIVVSLCERLQILGGGAPMLGGSGVTGIATQEVAEQELCRGDDVGLIGVKRGVRGCETPY